MKTSLLAKTCLVSSCLFSLALLPHAASAQSTNLSTVSSWQINPLSNSVSGNQTCRLQNEYDNGFVVAMDGDVNAFQTISIDFRQNIFDIGNPYNVTLMSDSGIVSQAMATAFSGSTLNIPLGNSVGQLRGASYLDANVEGNAFRFALNGLDSALSGYQNCVGAAPSSLTVSTPTAVTSVPVDLLPTTSAPRSSASVVAAGNAFDFDQRVRPQGDRRTMSSQLSSVPLDLLPAERRFVAGSTAPRRASVKPMPSNPNVLPLGGEGMMSAPAPQVEVFMEAPRAASPVFVQDGDVLKADFTSLATPQTRPAQRLQSDPIIPRQVEDGISRSMELKIDRLERELLAQRAENKNLEDELELNLEDSKEELVSITTDNWDLERATMRYNEAERQVKRLANQVQKEKARCDAQMKELEMMLFDPELTDTQQLATLAELEDKLFNAEEKLANERRKFEERIRVLEERLNDQ